MECRRTGAARAKRVLLTGATGCVGHCLARAILRETSHELWIAARDPGRLRLDLPAAPRARALRLDLDDPGGWPPEIGDVDCAVLAAAAWGGPAAWTVNLDSLQALAARLDPERTERIVFFSTASVLDNDGSMLEAASRIGTDYIRSKYEATRWLRDSPWGERTTFLFPTLVIGGEDGFPSSHFAGLLRQAARWAVLMRFFRVDGRFHIIHAAHAAAVARHCIDHASASEAGRWLVLGRPALTADDAARQFCAHLGQRPFLRLTLRDWMAQSLIRLFRIQMSDWDRFCMEKRDLRYDRAVDPASFGLPVHAATLGEALRSIGIEGRGNKGRSSFQAMI